MQTAVFTISQLIQKLVKHLFEQKRLNTKELCIKLSKLDIQYG